MEGLFTTLRVAGQGPASEAEGLWLVGAVDDPAWRDQAGRAEPGNGQDDRARSARRISGIDDQAKAAVSLPGGQGLFGPGPGLRPVADDGLAALVPVAGW
jgi:hypothetical protein